jgi:ABC-type transport system substrate-binding protein
MVMKPQQFPELIKQSKAAQLMMWGLAWTPSAPDGENCEEILYGPNAGQSNHSRFDLPQWNRLFEAAQKLPDGAERNALYRQMNKLFLAYAPWKLGVHRIYTDLMQPWVHGYHRHPVLRNWWQYIEIDGEAQRKAIAQ